MGNGLENPYRADDVADALFVGREALIAELITSIRAGRNAIRAVMGGRGMGKSSLARQIERRLETAAITVIASGGVHKVALRIGRAVGAELDVDDPVEALANAAKHHPAGRVLIVLDEIERLLHDPQGLGFLENLREAYEHADHRLAILVLGGTEVRDLLVDHASPFLRMAGGIHTLMGLERDEAAMLIRDPLNLDVPDDTVEALWAETAGHPWLLQMFMDLAVQRASSPTDVVAQLPSAIREAQSRLHSIGFPIWWSNLRVRGQEVYRRVVREAAATPVGQWVNRFGDDPQPWLRVLASTGVVALDDESVIARGALFQRWVEQNHPVAAPAVAPDQDSLDTWLTDVQVDAFERLVVRALAAWARATIEFPAAALKRDASSKSDNSGLSPEAFFQMHAIVALLQHERELIAEPEALSMKRQGRTDIKVRSRHDSARRASVEVKIYGRDDTDVVKQVLGYAAPGDTFAAVVSIDRCRRALRPVFEERCFAGAPPTAIRDAPAGTLQPAFYTEHTQQGYNPIRVWHFLVQLRDT